MAAFSAITIIYNPKSTGQGKRLAKQVSEDLRARMASVPVKIIATKQAGHAEQLAYEYAMATPRPLIISASGDGGYHEVVNGLMRARADGARPVAGLLPAGNANDHHRNIQQGDFLADICTFKTQQIDLLKLDATVQGKPYQRYAHSYIGLGVNAEIIHKLGSAKGSALVEIWLGIKVGWRFKPVRVVIDSEQKQFSGLVFSNVESMAKWFTVAQNSKPDDGNFEITRIPSYTKMRLLVTTLVGMAVGFRNPSHASRYAFQTTAPTLIQLDGEVTTLDADTQATVSIAHACWECIV